MERQNPSQPNPGRRAPESPYSLSSCIPTFEVVFRLGVVRAHDGRRLAPDHDQHPHPRLRLLLQQLPESEAGRVQLGLTL